MPTTSVPDYQVAHHTPISPALLRGQGLSWPTSGNGQPPHKNVRKPEAGLPSKFKVSMGCYWLSTGQQGLCPSGCMGHFRVPRPSWALQAVGGRLIMHLHISQRSHLACCPVYSPTTPNSPFLLIQGTRKNTTSFSGFVILCHPLHYKPQFSEVYRSATKKIKHSFPF